MWINIIDYRGDDKIIDARNTTLFDYRTRYLLRVQDDFHLWKKHGHKFRCFTQHDAAANCFPEFDDVIHVPRGNAATARNAVLDYFSGTKEDWFGIWDNDATLYWKKLRSSEFPENADAICELASKQNIYTFVPFNPQQAVYGMPDIGLTDWTFKSTITLKGTMLFVRNTKQRFDKKIDVFEDIDWGIQHTIAGRKCAVLEQISLREHRACRSTIFNTPNKDHPDYEKEKRRVKIVQTWNNNLDRRTQYAQAKIILENKWKNSTSVYQKMQRKLWK